jgi:hypothetical protein
VAGLDVLSVSVLVEKIFDPALALRWSELSGSGCGACELWRQVSTVWLAGGYRGGLQCCCELGIVCSLCRSARRAVLSEDTLSVENAMVLWRVECSDA